MERGFSMSRVLIVSLLAVALLVSACAGDDPAEQGHLPQPAEEVLAWDEQLAEIVEAYAHLAERWDAFVELALPGGGGRSSDPSRISDTAPLQLADLLERRPTASGEELAELTSSFDSLYAESREMYAEMRAVVTGAALLSESEREEAQQVLEEIAQAERALVDLAALLQRWRDANAHTSAGSS